MMTASNRESCVPREATRPPLPIGTVNRTSSGSITGPQLRWLLNEVDGVEFSGTNTWSWPQKHYGAGQGSGDSLNALNLRNHQLAEHVDVVGFDLGDYVVGRPCSRHRHTG